MKYFHITERELEEFTADFIQKLQKYMQEAIEYGQMPSDYYFVS